MKNSLFQLVLLLLLCSNTVLAQQNTEVYLFDIVETDGELKFENLRNISNSNGYDNQPSFFDNENILFSATRNGQTDIAKYNIPNDSIIWVTDTSEGSEYSPLRIPNTNDVSAIRLDTSGLQRLYRYDNTSKESKLLIEDLKVGYHLWDTDEQLITSVLVKEGMNLMLNYLPENKNNTINVGVGRSLHKIPNSDLMSFISIKNGAGIISSYDPALGKVKNIMNMPSKSQDMCWLDSNSILIPNGKSLMRAYLDKSKSLEVLNEFQEKEIHNISRIAVSPNGKQLVLVSDESPEMMVDKQVNTFNSRDLNAFVHCFSDNVIVSNFPNKLQYKGRSNMKINYGQHFESKLDTRVEIVNRIVLDNIIIDEEIVSEDEEKFHQAALYEVQEGYISSMAFIHENGTNKSPEEIFKDHDKYYNARSLDGLMTLYSNDIEVYNYPNKKISSGKQDFLNRYTTLFEKATDLEYQIVNQIVVGNKVINDEIVEIGSASFRRIAIYELHLGLIKNVTFIR